jgi:hypothetical protein
MVKACVLTAWSNVGTEERPRFRPAIVDAYGLTDWTDITGQPRANLTPDPNLLVLEIVTDEATLKRIEADGEYKVLRSEVVDAEREA